MRRAPELDHRLPRVFGPAALIIIAIALAAASVASTYDTFAHTFDEPAHIAAGIELLDRGTFSYEQQHPPFARLAVALGPYLEGARSHGETDIFAEGLAILYADDNYDVTLAAARLGVLPFLVVLIAVSAAWAYRDFGPTSAVATAALLATTPPLLAHAGLATTDVPLASMLVSALFAFRVWLDRPSAALGAAVGALAALAVMSKLSALVFLPATFFATALLNFVSAKVERVPGWRVVVPSLAASTVSFAVVIWVVYGCPLDALQPARQLWAGLGEALEHNARGHIAFFCGEVKFGGDWLFFPAAVILKTPLPFLLLIGVGIFYSFRHHRRDWRSLIPIANGFLIVGVAMLSRIDLGVRYVLPFYPLAAITAGAAAVHLTGSRSWLSWGFGCALLVGQVSASGISYPDYLAYFNVFAGSHPEQFLVDSDLDWGQDIKRVAAELHRRGITEVATALHTNAELTNAFPPHSELEWDEPATGWVVISLTRWALGTAHSPFDGYSWLERYTPVATIGKSVRLYYID